MGQCQFSKIFPPYWSVRVRTHVDDRLGLGLGLGVGSAPHVVGRLGSGMAVINNLVTYSLPRASSLDHTSVVIKFAAMK